MTTRVQDITLMYYKNVLQILGNVKIDLKNLRITINIMFVPFICYSGYSGYSSQQLISVYNTAGDALSHIKYYDGFIGQRIGPVSCLAFHPYRV